ncbi:MAG TPA: hypothetical protein VK175_06420 [Leadbetterella sp.]|nr:hypothetical protein [Leadbetterella sp.]
MKRLFYSMVFLFCSIGVVNAQSVNGVALKDIDTPYLLIMGVGKILQPKVTIDVDFGQKVSSKFFKDKEEVKILDEAGKLVEFNSMIDALNFFTKFGYEFVDAYAITVSSAMGGSQNVYHWLLKKK